MFVTNRLPGLKKYVGVILSLLLVFSFLSGCGNDSDNIQYGIGTASINETIGEEWKANQDVPTYSDGKVSAIVDSNNRITKLLAYFNEADMASDYVLYFGGKNYTSIEAVTKDFGEFNDDSIIEFSDGNVTLHVEITNKDKNEYYISLKMIN